MLIVFEIKYRVNFFNYKGAEGFVSPYFMTGKIPGICRKKADFLELIRITSGSTYNHLECGNILGNK